MGYIATTLLDMENFPVSCIQTIPRKVIKATGNPKNFLPLYFQLPPGLEFHPHPQNQVTL